MNKNPETDSTAKLITPGECYLVTSNTWFFGPDGHQYRAVYGRVWILEAERYMGFRPTRATNWYARVKGPEAGSQELLIPGDEFGPALKLDKPPTTIEGDVYNGKTTTPINSILILI